MLTFSPPFLPAAQALPQSLTPLRLSLLFMCTQCRPWRFSHTNSQSATNPPLLSPSSGNSLMYSLPVYSLLYPKLPQDTAVLQPVSYPSLHPSNLLMGRLDPGPLCLAVTPPVLREGKSILGKPPAQSLQASLTKGQQPPSKYLLHVPAQLFWPEGAHQVFDSVIFISRGSQDLLHLVKDGPKFLGGALLAPSCVIPLLHPTCTDTPKGGNLALGEG